jgi:hypothetical protein
VLSLDKAEQAYDFMIMLLLGNTSNTCWGHETNRAGESLHDVPGQATRIYTVSVSEKKINFHVILKTVLFTLFIIDV